MRKIYGNLSYTLVSRQITYRQREKESLGKRGGKKGISVRNKQRRCREA